MRTLCDRARPASAGGSHSAASEFVVGASRLCASRLPARARAPTGGGGDVRAGAAESTAAAASASASLSHGARAVGLAAGRSGSPAAAAGGARGGARRAARVHQSAQAGTGGARQARDGELERRVGGRGALRVARRPAQVLPGLGLL